MKNTYYAIAIVVVIIITIMVDAVCFKNSSFDDDNAKIEKLNQKSSLSKILEVKDSTKTTIAFTQVSLPPPPSAQVVNEDRHPASPLLINSDLGTIHANLKRKQVKPLKDTASMAILNQAQVDFQFTQMQALKDGGLTLAFPNSEIQTLAILEFMHQCIGIDIAAIQGDSVTLLSRKQNKHSPILRLATGVKTKTENALMKVYAPNQNLVRLYPQWFDRALSRHIATQIGNASLTHLSGHYHLEQNTLWLTKIKLNKQEVSINWKLSERTNCSQNLS